MLFGVGALQCPMYMPDLFLQSGRKHGIFPNHLSLLQHDDTSNPKVPKGSLQIDLNASWHWQWLKFFIIGCWFTNSKIFHCFTCRKSSEEMNRRRGRVIELMKRSNREACKRRNVVIASRSEWFWLNLCLYLPSLDCFSFTSPSNG